MSFCFICLCFRCAFVKRSAIACRDTLSLMRRIPQATRRDEELDQFADATAGSLRLGPGAAADVFDPAVAAHPGAAAPAGDASESAAAAAGSSSEEPEPPPEHTVVQWRPRRIRRENIYTGPDTSIYAVWALCRGSGDGQWAGLHLGAGTDAYAGLLLLNGECFGGLRWRCFPTVSAAEFAFRAETTSKKADIDSTDGPRIYWWPPKPPSAWD